MLVGAGGLVMHFCGYHPSDVVAGVIGAGLAAIGLLIGEVLDRCRG